MNLLKACRANFSPIFGLFSDPSGEIDAILEQVMKGSPFAVIEENGVINTAWRLNDAEKLAFITEYFNDKKILIADGHHRYETALNYYNENRNEADDSAHVMMFLTNLEAQSLAVYPIHRLIKCPTTFDEAEFINQIENYFSVEPISEGIEKNKIRKALDSADAGDIVFYVYFGQGRGCFIKIKEKNIPLLLVNARITKKSFDRWKKIISFSKKIFGKFDLCIVSNKETENYLKFLGAKNIKRYVEKKIIL